MSKPDYTKCSNFLTLYFLIIFVQCCASAPVNVTENAYSQFIAELNRNKCSVPNQVQLPFDTTKVNNFEYLSSYLEICQKTESTKHSKEAVILCKEIFDNVRNISCSTKTALPDITLGLSKNVCEDIGTLKDSVPVDDKSLLKRLTDSLLCDILCEGEFEKACQVLLWSYNVEKMIASAKNAEESEQPNMSEDGGELNDKQDNAVDEGNLPQSDANAENEKKKTEGAKGENTVPDRIAEVSEPHDLADNPEQTPDATAIPSKNEKPTPSNTVAESRDASESINSLKAFNTIPQKTQAVHIPNSNTEAKPVEDMPKDESSVQNTNIQTEKHDQADIINRPAQEFNTNFADNGQAHELKVKVLTDGHAQDNSHIPANQDIPLNVRDNIPSNEILGENSQITDQNEKSAYNQELPHESENDKKPNDEAVGLQDNEPNPSGLVDKHQTAVGNEEKSAKKTVIPITGEQTVKDTTQKQDNKDVIQQQTNKDVTQQQTTKDSTVQQTNKDKPQDKISTSLLRDESKANQPQANSESGKIETKGDQLQANSDSGKMETQDHTETDMNTADETINTLKEQKKPNIAEQTKEFNTIPDITRTSISADQKPLENDQPSKATAVNPDFKSAIPSSPAEASTKTTATLEQMEDGNDLHPQPEDENNYDMDNTDDDFPRPEEEVGFDKDANRNMPVPAVEKTITNPDEKPIDFPSRNSYGQETSDIQMIAAFPDQEDGHFFFYFLTVVLILMAGYLIFHNKQKIIALIVEGRHERSRRSHRIGYKKLETK